MSWQCPICETVNLDVTPVCTVCDNLAPVIQSYLSLQAIDLLQEYNKKLDAIHTLEADGNYEEMLNTAMEAISLYRENSLALDKAKHALIHLNQFKLKKQISDNINNAIEKEDFTLADSLFQLLDSFGIDTSEFATFRSEVRNQLFCKNEIAKILDDSYEVLIELNTDKALQIVKEGLDKYPSSELLQCRQDEIEKFSCKILKEKENDKKLYSKSPQGGPPAEGSPKPEDKKSKRKFPTVTRHSNKKMK